MKIFPFSLALIASVVLSLSLQASEKPNIIIVLADDMGWGDSATYGHPTTQTPYLDKLAAEGVKFTQCYSACGVCSPSRSAILTGRTPYRNGVWRHLSGKHKAHLRASEITYPELLQEIGYQTCHVGKWHLLSKPQFQNPEYPQPNEHGYDYWMATHNNADPSHENPKNFYRNGEPVGKLEGYSAPLVADEAIHWLKTHRKPSNPFALSVWFHEPHKPIATDIKFSQLYEGHSEKEQTYFGNITQLDYALGQIMKTLDELEIAQNTLLFFTSDNGPLIPEGGSTGSLRGAKRSDYEGGIRVPGLLRWPEKIPAGTTCDTPIIGTDLFSTILDIVDLPLPKDRTIDGVSILPALKGEPLERKTPLFWRTHVSSGEDRVAMRIDDWKIVANDTLEKFQLFNLKEDWKETTDLAAKHPEKTEEMKTRLLTLWKDISEEGPNEWWESEGNKPKRGATLNY